MQIHGTADTTVPYVNGKEVNTRAQSVGLSSSLITLDGAGHVPWDRILEPKVVALTMKNISTVLDLKDAQQPQGCTPQPSIFLK